MAVKRKIRKGDMVLINAGEYKNQRGRVLKVLTKANRAIVEGIGIVKRHTKPSRSNAQGGIIEKEGPIHISNLSIVASGEGSRVGYRLENNRKVRYAKKTGEAL